MIFKRFVISCSISLLLVTSGCSGDSITSIEPVEVRPQVTIKTPIDANGIINNVEANAVIVEGTATLEEGYVVIVHLSDGQNSVAGTAIVKAGKWETQSLAISGFNNGGIIVTAEGTNERGTMSNTAEVSLYLDQVSPNINITGPIAGNDTIDSEEATTVLVKGYSDAANGQMVLITFGDETASHLTTKTSINNGKWEAIVDVSSLKSGSLMLMAEVTDFAGNPATVQRSGVILN